MIVGCLTALLRQSVTPFEVLVIDNLSTDATAQRARSAEFAALPIRVIAQDERQGLIPTRDRGFADARGDVLARIDADTVVDADWVQQLTNCFASEGVAAVTGPVRYYDLPFRAVWQRVDGWGRRLLFAADPRHPFLFGSNMAIRRTAWLQIAGGVCADTDDRFHEDIDLAIHLYRADLTIEYVPTLQASISARRLGCTSDAFAEYMSRFERTYRAHGTTAAPMRCTVALLRALFPILHHAYVLGLQLQSRLDPRVNKPAL